MALRGHHEHSLDDKNRLTIPSEMRKQLGTSEVVVSRGLDACVTIWTAEAFESFTSSFLSGMNPLSQDARRLSRYFNSGSYDVELDKSGRVMVPAKLLEHAGLSRDVAIVGDVDHIELWEPQAYAAYDAETSTNLEETVANIVSAG